MFGASGYDAHIMFVHIYSNGPTGLAPDWTPIIAIAALYHLIILSVNCYPIEQKLLCVVGVITDRHNTHIFSFLMQCNIKQA